ncbi:histidine phosphatase family protein [Microlunatus panaciterrae]|uniref:Phosphohistidine phosphatase n=1 Tax=Microlunatus panaciterrae TaxID=400768 RepID=A0ABS2RHI8_9ACTN|nr:histidine phosphatase family protein [Microlunatus panaciterrae]MBM7798475.1 phosphohistidine phosphatase [Microlunatus panaciterrae]
MSHARTLLLLRHAEAEDTNVGRRDQERPLTVLGQRQASAVGAYLRQQEISVDQALCSPATRARQTWEGLGLAAEVDYDPRLYNAGSDTILAVLQEVPSEVRTALVVGHAPGVPALAHQLADPFDSDAEAFAAIEHRFPTATLVMMAFHGDWAELRVARLEQARLQPS